MTKALQIFGMLLGGGLLASAQVGGSLGDNERKTLVRKSYLIVVAIPEPESRWVVNRPKMRAAHAKNLVANPSDYVVGELFNARVVDILKTDGSVKKDELLKVFVIGRQAILDRGNIVRPEEKNIFFLSRMNEADPRLKDVGVYLPEKTPEVMPFDPSNVYEPTDEVFGVVSFTPRFLKTIQHDIRAQARANPRN